jgi:hypothetical protein
LYNKFELSVSIIFSFSVCLTIQWAVTASVDYSFAILLQVIILLSTGGANGGYLMNKYQLLAIHGGVLLLHAALNNLPINWLAHLGKFAALWNIIGIPLISCNICCFQLYIDIIGLA